MIPRKVDKLWTNKIAALQKNKNLFYLILKTIYCEQWCPIVKRCIESWISLPFYWLLFIPEPCIRLLPCIRLPCIRLLLKSFVYKKNLNHLHSSIICATGSEEIKWTCIKFIDKQTTNSRQSEKLSWAFSSGDLIMQ